MLDFMDYIQLAFAEATNWNRDNSYSSLTATAQCMWITSYLNSDNHSLNLTAYSITRLLDTGAPTRASFLPSHSSLRDQLYPRHSWIDRWLRVVPLQHCAFEQYSQPERPYSIA
jgi:hypothetical protein